MQIISQGIFLDPGVTKANKDAQVEPADRHLSLPEESVNILSGHVLNKLRENQLSSHSAVTQWRERGE